MSWRPQPRQRQDQTIHDQRPDIYYLYIYLFFYLIILNVCWSPTPFAIMYWPCITKIQLGWKRPVKLRSRAAHYTNHQIHHKRIRGPERPISIPSNSFTRFQFEMHRQGKRKVLTDKRHMGLAEHHPISLGHSHRNFSAGPCILAPCWQRQRNIAHARMASLYSSIRWPAQLILSPSLAQARSSIHVWLELDAFAEFSSRLHRYDYYDYCPG